MDSWTELERIDSTLVKALRIHFPSPQQVATAFDDLRGARALVEEALANSYGAARREAIAGALVEWQNNTRNRLKRLRLSDVKERLEHGKQSDSLDIGITMADSYESIISGSPLLGLAALESHFGKEA